MVTSEDQLKELKEFFGGVAVAKEGGIDYVLMSNAPMPPGCTPENCDILFCPSPREGYSSRLYFGQKVEGPGTRNWNGSVYILNRNWRAFSVNFSHPSDLRLVQAVQTHLSGFRVGFHP